MGSMFRSEEMALCQLFIQPEAGYSSVSLLGELGIAHFRDMNEGVNPFSRKFVSEVRRCEELERKMRYIEEGINKDGVAIREPTQLPKAPNPREIINLEARVEKTETEMLELTQNGINLKSNFKELKEMEAVLVKAQTFMSEQEEWDSNRPLIQGDERGSLGFIAGVIPRHRVPGFERMLWRVSRGNVFLRQSEIEEPLEDPASGQKITKTAFLAFYQGESLKSRLKKVCTGYHASLYTCPSSNSEREGIIRELRVRLADLDQVLDQTLSHRHRVLVSVAKELRTWQVMVLKVKAIYHTLNLFNMDVTTKCLIGECWVPKADLERLKEALETGGREVGSSINSFVNVLPTKEDPPSYIRTNEFTQGFQTLIDAYAMSSYREVNPGFFTIITFPFLFSVMFGDLGHGLVITVFAAWMVGFQNKLRNKKWGEIWDIFFGGRYIILLMGIFSMYSGLMYNDAFSLSLNIFGSAYSGSNYDRDTLMKNGKLTLDPATKDFKGVPYVFGLDPAWQTAENKIIFLNSFKMKFSIIVAVAHMVFGICLSVANHINTKKYENIFLDFIPQILFLLLMFGYMAFMIIFKYFKYYSTLDETDPLRSACAPSVLINFINMVLVSANPVPPKNCEQYLYDGQHEVQIAFLLLALLQIPILLFAKPAYHAIRMRRKAAARSVAPIPKTVSNGISNGDVESRASVGDTNGDIEMRASVGDVGDVEQALQIEGGHSEHEEHEEEDEPFSEIMVHQAIHTVEYVLSTVSHTASYLRLWALSLAHAQLSEVLWTMVFRKGIQIGYNMQDTAPGGVNIVGGIIIYVVFALWLFFTVAVLVLMEGLSAFLHTLRLHWVEFMSKFYMGAGYAFEPFSFKGILTMADPA